MKVFNFHWITFETSSSNGKRWASQRIQREEKAGKRRSVHTCTADSRGYSARWIFKLAIFTCTCQSSPSPHSVLSRSPPHPRRRNPTARVSRSGSRADGDPAGTISARADLTSFVPPPFRRAPPPQQCRGSSRACATRPARRRRASGAPTSWALWPRPVAVAPRPTQLHCSHGDRRFSIPSRTCPSATPPAQGRSELPAACLCN